MDSLFLDFINSRWNITHKPYYDPLDSRGWIEELLKKWRPDLAIPTDEPDMGEFKRLRKLLSDVIGNLQVNGIISAEHTGEINKYLSLSAYRFELGRNASGCSMTMKPLKCGWNDALTKIAYSYAEFIIGKDAGRLKQCGNNECKWVFYDESRNRTRKWCCNTCASLMKVRRFREKNADN